VEMKEQKVTQLESDLPPSQAVVRLRIMEVDYTESMVSITAVVRKGKPA